MDSCFFSFRIRVKLPQVCQVPGSDLPKSAEAGTEAARRKAPGRREPVENYSVGTLSPDVGPLRHERAVGGHTASRGEISE